MLGKCARARRVVLNSIIHNKAEAARSCLEPMPSAAPTSGQKTYERPYAPPLPLEPGAP